MKAAVLTGMHRFDIRDIPAPKIVHETDVLIRIKTVGVCGSDIHYYTTGRIGTQIVEFPFIIGHETAGVVERIGSTVKRVRPGQRVAVDPSVSCGVCDQCKAGREHTCRKLLFLGCPKQLEGCLSEFIVLPEENVFPIPDQMTYEQATLSEPLAIAVYAVERSGLPPAGNVAILGAGPIGMSLFHVLRTRNAGHIYITDKIEERLAFARTLRPLWAGNPDKVDVLKEISRAEPSLLDVVFECSGNPEAIAQGVQLMKPGGALVIVGIPEVDEVSFPIHELRRKEITILNIRRQVHCTQKALDLLASRIINMDAMATHHFTLDQTQAAFDLVASYGDGVMKAMISME
jgi:L-iditol 2-dehydrogenase